MQLADFLIEFKRRMPASTHRHVLAAMRQDPLVWDSLQKPDFYKEAMDYANGSPELWNPATLALIYLGRPLPLDHLRSLPLRPVDQDLRQQAAHAYEEASRTALPPADLGQAGLLALALRERRRLTNTWSGLLEELELAGKGSAATLWRTPLACLYAMAPDPVDLLASLLPPEDRLESEDLTPVVNTLLSNPLPLAEQARTLVGLLKRYSPAGQLTCLRHFQALGHSALAAQTASALIAASPSLEAGLQSPLPDQAINDSDPFDGSLPPQAILEPQQGAAFYSLAQDSEKAISLLEQALENSRLFQAGLLRQMLQAARQKEDDAAALAALRKAFDLVPESQTARAQLAIELVKAGQTDEAGALLPDQTGHAFLLIASGHLAAALKNIPAARQYARRAAQAVLSPTDSSSPSDRQPVYRALLRLLLDLELYPELIKAAGAGFTAHPNDPDLIHALFTAYKRTGNLNEAIRAGYLSILLQPEELEVHRDLATLLENAKEWEKALEEWCAIQASASTPTLADQLAVARCAVQARQPELAQGACQTILDDDPENGMAHAYLGEALLLLGDGQAALEHITQATLLAPSQAAPWLALARAQTHNGDQRKSFETLRAAVHAAPLSAEIHLALAKSSLENGSPSEALPSLRQASRLDPKSAQVALRLGETLYALGHLPEARQVLEQARQDWPMHADLAYTHARVLLSLEEIDAAIVALGVSLASHPNQIGPYIDYASALIARLRRERDERLSDAAVEDSAAPAVDLADAASVKEALASAMQIDPENLKARISLAEISLLTGEYENAIDAFLKVTEGLQNPDPALNLRIKIGIGQAALALKQLDTALAALQEAARIDPNDLETQHVLAQAYCQANLLDEAMQAAYTSQRLAPHEPANLVWFARLACAAGYFNDAVSALERAVQLLPERTDLVIHLARTHLQAGNLDAARETFQSLITHPSPTSAELEEAGHALVQLNDIDAAVACLERALQVSPAPGTQVFSDLAILLQKQGDPSKALEAVQRALEVEPANPRLYVIEADLHVELHREQAAQACLEQALSLAAGLALDNAHPEAQEDLYLVHNRFAALLRASGNLPAASSHADLALEIYPELLEARWLAAELAYALLENERALSILAQADSSEAPAGREFLITHNPLVPHRLESELAQDLFCLRTELLLESGQTVDQGDLIEQAERFENRSIRLEFRPIPPAGRGRKDPGSRGRLQKGRFQARASPRPARHTIDRRRPGVGPRRPAPARLGRSPVLLGAGRRNCLARASPSALAGARHRPMRRIPAGIREAARFHSRPRPA